MFIHYICFEAKLEKRSKEALHILGIQFDFSGVPSGKTTVTYMVDEYDDYEDENNVRW